MTHGGHADNAPHSHSPPPMLRWRPRRLFGVVLAAALLLQVAWILALPGFRGSDEFDHVYKADAVAHGQLMDAGPAANGRGGMLTVRREIVEASAATCNFYAYTRPDNCRIVEALDDGKGTVASAASLYNPVYYLVVGTLSKPFNGNAFVIALRCWSALFCALLIAWAAVITARWAQTAWPMAALLVTTTPVLIYSTAVGAPNGVGYAAAVVLWAALLSIVNNGPLPWTALTLAAILVMLTHTTGVLWVFVTTVVALTLLPLRAWLEVGRRHRLAWGLATSTVFLGAVACMAYVILAAPNARGREVSDGSPAAVFTIADALSAQVTWILQTVAAFPVRNEQTHSFIYVLWLSAFMTLLVLGLRESSRRIRRALALAFAAWVAVPLAFTAWSFDTDGVAWQGRYALPIAVGIAAMLGMALDRSRLRLPRPATVALLVATGVCHVASITKVMMDEADRHLAPTFVAEVPGGHAIVWTLAVLGALLPLLARPERLAHEDRPPPRPQEPRISQTARV